MPLFEIIDVKNRKGNGFKDLTGKKIGRLTVKGLSKRKAGRKSFWVCQCECGNTSEVRSDRLTGKGQITLSCGCYKKEQDIKNLHITNHHGMTKHPIYPIWRSMMSRCYNSKQERYRNYGGRGIKVCDEWHDPRVFIDWAEKHGYKTGLFIERIDVNSWYSPDNCTWITLAEQHYNKTTNVFHEYNGERLTTMQWQRRLGIPLSKVTNYKSKGIDFIDLIKQYYKEDTEVTD